MNIHINSVNIHFFHFCLLNLMKNSVYEKEKGAYTILKQMVDNGFVTASGRGDGKKYYAAVR